MLESLKSEGGIKHCGTAGYVPCWSALPVLTIRLLPDQASANAPAQRVTAKHVHFHPPAGSTSVDGTSVSLSLASLSLSSNKSYKTKPH